MLEQSFWGITYILLRHVKPLSNSAPKVFSHANVIFGILLQSPPSKDYVPVCSINFYISLYICFSLAQRAQTSLLSYSQKNTLFKL